VGKTTIVITKDQDLNTGRKPIAGQELTALVATKIPEGSDTELFVSKTLAILGDCVAPDGMARKTGLVVGKVQSGKTLSFTAVAAAAHDNGYRLIIVLSGTKKMLAQQTLDRLRKDLRIEANSMRPWRAYHNPNQKEVEGLKNMMDLWDQPNAPIKLKNTVVITVHKNRAKLEALSATLKQIGVHRLGSPLIIDDEADQAGLNTKVRQGTESPTYRAILNLRDALPYHTYLQYTATPQGNLLIPLIDLLSPDFGHVLSPGDGYIGGVELFKDHLSASSCLRQIPTTDIPEDGDLDAEPPHSLHQAMRLFFVGVADWLVREPNEGDANRSMMVHPSRLKNSHDLYAKWVNARINSWRQLLSDLENPDRVELLENFEHAYKDLASTVELRPFSQLSEQLIYAMQMTEVKIVNSSGTIDIPWKQHPVWLLVGGANLDRGFTVEGLTVTYMPRGPGVGNADTIQQRGRFFGYKSEYIGYCRIFLESDIEQMFRSYVTHERSFHEWLVASIESGTDLRQLQRKFVIDPSMRPTRAAILSDDVAQVRLKPWFFQETLLQSIPDCLFNANLFDSFIETNSIKMQEDDPGTLRSSERAPHQRHLWSETVPLRLLHMDLLATARIPGSDDRSRWMAALLLIERWLDDNPDDHATVVRMRPGQVTKRALKQKAGDVRRLENPFQGAHPDKHGAIYPGDMKIRSNHVTLQLHEIDLYDGLVSDGDRLESAVPVLALWLDEPLRSDVVTTGGTD
jgi:hypothetical protein